MENRDETFITTFEKKYLEKYGKGSDNRIGLPGLSPQLVDKQAEMEETNRKLEEARLKFEQWKTSLQQKRKDIEEKQQKLAEQKRQLDAFTLLHKADLQKYHDREALELEQSRAMEQELEQLRKNEKELRVKNEHLESDLEKLRPIANYLQEVVDTYSTFDSIESIINRHTSLAETRTEYLKKFQEMTRKMGNDEAIAMKELEKERVLLIDAAMKYNHSLSMADETKKDNVFKKTNVIKDVQRSENKSLELSMIKTSIQTIYNRAVNKVIGNQNRTYTKKENMSLEEMLKYVQNKYVDLESAIEDWKKKTAVPNALATAQNW